MVATRPPYPIRCVCGSLWTTIGPTSPHRHADAVPILTDPLVPRWERSLRDEVRALRAGPRGAFPALLVAGRPAGVRLTLPAAPLESVDGALRVDLLDALLARAGQRITDPWVWLSRPGTIAVDERWADRWWTAAFAQLCKQSPEIETTAAFVVLTRGGWYDPRGECCRRWTRLRRHVAPRS